MGFHLYALEWKEIRKVNSISQNLKISLIISLLIKSMLLFNFQGYKDSNMNLSNLSKLRFASRYINKETFKISSEGGC